MGTLLAVTARAGSAEDVSGTLAEAFAIAATWERVLSRHDPASCLSRVNRAAGRWTAIDSAELALALRRARALARLTRGCFDPTAAPILALWRRAARRGAVPSARALARARARVGWRGIRVRRRRVALARAGMALDLGGFGKGLALDRIVSRLGRRGPALLLNFGESSLAPAGRRLGRGWPVLLRDPRGGFAGELRLVDEACSTSGTHGQTVVVAGRRRSHIVDPRDGRPVRGHAQVTVLARSAAVAEALSTAILVAGRSEMERLAARVGGDACWIDASGVHTTPGFALRS
jgi:FAD:protein FMN transferase